MKILNFLGSVLLPNNCSLYQALPYLANINSSQAGRVISKINDGISFKEIKMYLQGEQYSSHVKETIIQKKLSVISFNLDVREFLLDTGIDKNIREAVASKVEDLDEKYFDMVLDFLNSGYKKESDFIEIKLGYLCVYRGVGGIILSHLTKDNDEWAKRIEENIKFEGFDYD